LARVLSQSDEGRPTDSSDQSDRGRCVEIVRPFGCAVRVHHHQRVEVPPEELSIHLGSHRAWQVGDYLPRSPEEEGL